MITLSVDQIDNCCVMTEGNVTGLRASSAGFCLLFLAN